MAASKDEISKWFDEGKNQGYDFMIIASDTWDNEDFPIYTNLYDYKTKFNNCSYENEMRIMEIYNLHLNKDYQLGESRSFHGLS